MKKLYSPLKSHSFPTFTFFKTTFAVFLFLLTVISCSKQQVDPKPAIVTIPKEEVKPEPVIIPKETEVKYSYQIENISDQTLYTFNNDAANPKENYAEVLVLAGQKTVVQALSVSKITPMIRSDKVGLQTEFIYNYLTAIYQINGYMNLFEASITGDAGLVSIYFPNPATGKADSLINVKLPQVLLYKTFVNQTIEIIVSKEVVSGIVSLTTKIKGKADISQSTSASQGIISSTTDLAKKTTTVKVEEPTAVTPNTPTKPVSSCGMYNGKPVYSGPKGGCYYINSNGNKTYVARNFCC